VAEFLFPHRLALLALDSDGMDGEDKESEIRAARWGRFSLGEAATIART